MNMKHINVVLCIGLLLLCAFIASVANAGASVTELNVNPSVVVQGETLSISGKATSNEEVLLKSSFVISLPISEDTYSEEFNGIHFPAGKKTFSVRAENIKDIRVSLGPILFLGTVKYPMDGPQKATNGIATISISLPIMGMDVTGEKDVKVYGAALDDATSVILTTDMAIKVTADKNGDFKLDLDTEGIPLGELSIAAGGKEKTVQIVRTKPKPAVFDTGSPEYPYPSMCGIHNGTITPNQTITVSQLYTYSCLGTCGHTERVTIWNDMGVIVEANWTGYRGDWRNMTFDAVTLVAGETYNYSICTGSYPQIIHERTANVTGGTITCSQFTDANGNVYIDWIPAIILK